MFILVLFLLLMKYALLSSGLWYGVVLYVKWCLRESCSFYLQSIMYMEAAGSSTFKNLNPVGLTEADIGHEC